MQNSFSDGESNLITSEEEMSLDAEIRILICDFDHTLFLSNSTEEYLDCAQPKVLVAVVLAVLEGLQPWKLLLIQNSRFVYRDAIRVSVISILFPWTWLIWQSKVSHTLTSFANEALILVSKQPGIEKRIVASNGFAFILKPLLQNLDFQTDILIATHLRDLRHSPRNLGKLTILKEKLDKHELDFACFITDNEEDAPLLKAVRQPILLSWRAAKHFRACQNTYIPFVYTEGSKRGSKQHFIKRLLLQEYVIILVAYGMNSYPGPLPMISFLLLFLSFSCIYEAGYYENDFHEIYYEESKGIGKKIEKFKDYPIERGAWTWALTLSVIGLISLEYADFNYWFFSESWLAISSLWMFFLGVTRLIFRIYNYSAVSIRMILYPALQACKFFGFLVFTSTNIVGLFLIFSQIICSWFWYLVYRANGDRSSIPHHIIRLTIFVTLSVGCSLSIHEPSLLGTRQFLAGLVWCLLLCTNQISIFWELRNRLSHGVR